MKIVVIDYWQNVSRCSFLAPKDLSNHESNLESIQTQIFLYTDDENDWCKNVNNDVIVKQNDNIISTI